LFGGRVKNLESAYNSQMTFLCMPASIAFIDQDRLGVNLFG
jgi:hypothetical protein